MKKLLFLLLLAAMPMCAQTTVAPFVNPKVQFFNGGAPCSGCLLSTFAAGQSTPLATYSESTGTTPNANPVVLDANGMASIYLTSASYKFVLKTAANVPIWTQDGVSWLTPLTTFPQGSVAGNFDITQPTAAINGANQSSFSSCIHGAFFNVASLDDKWCFQNVIGTGTSPTSTLTLTHSGSSGAATFSILGNVSVGGTLGVTGATTEKIINSSVLFADQYCTTPGLLDQTCIQNALTAIGNLAGPNFIAGAEIVLKAGQTFSVNACTTDAKGTYGILLDQKSGLTISGDGARILLNVNNNSCRTIEVRSSSHVVIKGVTLASANSLIGTAVSYRRPSNADPGTATVDNILKNVKINPANVAGSAFNIGIEMGVTGEGQVSENKLEHVEINQANTCVLQDGGASETNVYDHVTCVGTTNSILWDLRASSATLIAPVTGGTSLGITHLKVSGTFRNLTLINPHMEVSQSANAADTAKAILWATTQGLMDVVNGDFSDFRPSSTSTLFDFSTGGSGGTIHFLNTVVFRSGGTANIVMQNGVGPTITRFDGAWTNTAVTGMTTNNQHFISFNLGTITNNFSYGFDNGCVLGSEGAGTTSFVVKCPASYGGVPSTVFRFANNFMGPTNSLPFQADADNTVQFGQSGTRFSNGFFANLTPNKITYTGSTPPAGVASHAQTGEDASGNFSWSNAADTASAGLRKSDERAYLSAYMPNNPATTTSTLLQWTPDKACTVTRVAGRLFSASVTGCSPFPTLTVTDGSNTCTATWGSGTQIMDLVPTGNCNFAAGVALTFASNAGTTCTGAPTSENATIQLKMQ